MAHWDVNVFSPDKIELWFFFEAVVLKAFIYCIDITFLNLSFAQQTFIPNMYQSFLLIGLDIIKVTTDFKQYNYMQTVHIILVNCQYH